MTEKGDLDAAATHCERGLEIADAIGAERFKPFMSIFIGRIGRTWRAADTGRKTVAMMKDAVETARQTGIQFLGPWVLGTLALVTDDWREAQKSLAEAEKILERGCVGHNYFGFYRDAIAVGLHAEQWDEAQRYADALTAWLGNERLPWAEFFAARGRALAAHGRGVRDRKTMAELARLKTEAERAGLLAAVPAIDQALAA